MDIINFDGQNDFVRLITKINSDYEEEKGRKKLAKITTYGCQGNEADSEHIKGLLGLMGYGFTENVEEADLAIFNTCAVREHAEQRVFGNVGALKGIKEKRPSMIIAVCGCMTQQQSVADKIKKSYPYVDLVFGTHALEKLPEMLFRAINGKRVFELGGEDTVVENIPSVRSSAFKAWLPVMYGCNNFCSYCIVPYVRGRERSRRPSDIIAEAKAEVKAGAKEITLLGQNVNSYGKGLSEKTDFATLLREVNAIEGDFRIHFMTSHPKDATPELFDAMAECEKVTKHLHLPFQSGSTEILRRMNRRYTKEQYLNLIDEVKKRVPGISLTSDIIVGFPGETYEDFKETLEVVKKVKFDNLFTFIYSPREGTPAAKLPDPITHAEKAKWMSELLAVQEKISSENMSRYVGKKERVLCESCEDGTVSGRTDTNVVVRFGGSADMVGTFQSVTVTEARRSMLVGEMR